MAALGGIVMRFIFGATLVVACLSVTLASADDIHKSDGHSTADFGVGGWTMSYGVGGWAQGSKAFGNGADSFVASSATKDGVFNIPTGERPLPLRSRPDSDCVFVAEYTPAGTVWRPGCK
jgi:hypothetical protein